jgi:hypothetical protein
VTYNAILPLKSLFAQEYPSMAEQADELTASYYRCRRDEHFLDTFYDGFLSKSPAIAQMFAQTDFKIQKLVLRQSLLEMLCFDRGMSGTREEIERLGLRHKEFRVSPEMYAMWLDAVSIAECFTPPRPGSAASHSDRSQNSSCALSAGHGCQSA